MTGSHAPGTLFSAVDSPFEVVYTAFDGRQSSECRFALTVQFDRRIVQRSAPVAATFPVTVVDLPRRHVRRVTQALLGSDLAPLRQLDNLDLAAFTELRLSLTTPVGQPLAIRTRAQATRAQIVVDLTWTHGC